MHKTKTKTNESMLPLPLQFLAAWLAVWIGRVQQQQIDYLKAENRALKEALGDRTSCAGIANSSPRNTIEAICAYPADHEHGTK